MAKIPTILEAGRADGKLIKTDSIYDDNQEKFLSDKIKEIDNNHNTLNDKVESLTDIVNNNESDIETKLVQEKLRASNAENNLRETIDNITEVNGSATSANIVTIDNIPNTSSSNVQQALNELFKNATFAGIATPTTNPGTPDGPVFYLATEAGTYSNFNGISVADGEAVILQWNNGVWTKKTTRLATEQEIIYDVSARNGGAVFESLSTLLSSSNLSTLIPTLVRHGGMSIRFIQSSISSSDNKYVRYNLLADSFTTDVEKWAICEDCICVDSLEFVRVITDKNDKIIIAIEKNGNIYFGYGVPKQVVDYIHEKIIELNMNTVPDIITFIGNLIEEYSTLQQIFDKKVDKVEGKSLINTNVAESVSYDNVSSDEYISALVDKEEKVIIGVTAKGKIVQNGINTFSPSPFVLYNGKYTSSGGTINDTESIRLQELDSDGYLYAITFPDSIKAFSIERATSSSDSNSVLQYDCPFSIKNGGKDSFVKIYFSYKDNSSISIDDPICQEIKVYKVPCGGESQYDITVAVDNSNIIYQKKADVVLTDSNCNDILCALFGCRESIKVLLFPGNYLIKKFWTIDNNIKISICLNYHYFGYYYNTVTIDGYNKGTRTCDDVVNLVVDKTLHESMENNNSNYNYFIIGAPYASTNSAIQRAPQIVDFKNFNVIGYKYDKPVTYIDTTRCASTMLQNVNIRGWAEHPTGYYRFDDIPNEECTGIRVGRGSNYGIMNYIKNSNIWYCYKGIACNGEHFIFEDVKTHHNYIGWYFGDRYTVGKMEHPNIMLGCSIEGCFRTMVLTKNGITEEYESIQAAEQATGMSIPKSTLVCIAISTESIWDIPGTDSHIKTKPALEIIKGSYRGRLEIDGSSTFETGSGINFKVTAY